MAEQYNQLTKANERVNIAVLRVLSIKSEYNQKYKETTVSD